jgi:hypothetical protein
MPELLPPDILEKYRPSSLSPEEAAGLLAFAHRDYATTFSGMPEAELNRLAVTAKHLDMKVAKALRRAIEEAVARRTAEVDSRLARHVARKAAPQPARKGRAQPLTAPPPAKKHADADDIGDLLRVPDDGLTEMVPPPAPAAERGIKGLLQSSPMGLPRYGDKKIVKDVSGTVEFYRPDQGYGRIKAGYESLHLAESIVRNSGIDDGFLLPGKRVQVDVGPPSRPSQPGREALPEVVAIRLPGVRQRRIRERA